MQALYSGKENRLTLCIPPFEIAEKQEFTITLESCEYKEVVSATLSEICQCYISIDFELSNINSGVWHLCLTYLNNNVLLSDFVKIV